MRHLTNLKNKIKLPVNIHGQSLLEITVALGALAVLLTVVTTSIVTSISNSRESKLQNQASIYAQQGIEIVRQMRDSDWSSFDSLSGVYCMAGSCSKLTASGVCGHVAGSCGQNLPGFRREVNLIKNDATCSQGANNSTRVVVTVSWNDSKCPSPSNYCRNVVVETCYTNLYGDTPLE